MTIKGSSHAIFVGWWF